MNLKLFFTLASSVVLFAPAVCSAASEQWSEAATQACALAAIHDRGAVLAKADREMNSRFDRKQTGFCPSVVTNAGQFYDQQRSTRLQAISQRDRLSLKPSNCQKLTVKDARANTRSRNALDSTLETEDGRIPQLKPDALVWPLLRSQVLTMIEEKCRMRENAVRESLSSER